MNSADGFWSQYYADVHREGRPWLDYSNEAVQMQSLSLALEGAGPIAGRSCLDVGSGNGQFAQALAAFGAAQVTAIELVAETVERLRRDCPSIDWRCGDAGAMQAYTGIKPADLVVALEVLQYLPLAATIERLWGLVRPGGRLVGVIPNADCPIVAKPVARFAGHFVPVSAAQLVQVIGGLPATEGWAYRGLTFATEQVIVPYVVSPWTRVGTWDAPPNRFQFVVRRSI
jgi:2-polyprenyl-3-methyl-5-hydroxy-6-metoxy-1,4-benzoquinol methylase